MPCFQCDARQTDPSRGDNPWERAVVRGEQILVCPICQQSMGWTHLLDRCARCGSTQLIKALGAIACRSCGLESWPDATAGSGQRIAIAEPASDLAAEVSAALERVLRRTPSPSRP